MTNTRSSGEASGGGGRPASEVDTSVLQLSPAERDERGIDDETVVAAFLAVARDGSPEAKDLQGITLPALPLDRVVVEGSDRHPIDLRDATIEGPISAEFATIKVPILLDGATVGGFQFDNARFEDELSCSGIRVTGEIDAFEARFDGDAHFDDATFEDAVSFDEAIFDDDTDFDDATFEDAVQFRGTEFHGDSNLLDDNTSFTGATFAERAAFEQAEFGAIHFEEVDFESDVIFEEATFPNDAEFADTEFAELADFDEARFREDVDFSGAEFCGVADFEGAVFSGGQRSLEEDADFRDVVFHDEADFLHASFRSATFQRAAFEALAHFEATEFGDDATFAEATFAAEADFDESRFDGDADFSDVHFAGHCDFRGAEFRGGDNFLDHDAAFSRTRFDADADFASAHFSAASFDDTAFGGAINFRDSRFTDRIDFSATQVDDDAFVDFTRAKIRTGRINQPAEGWVRYDMTLASIGDIDLSVERKRDSTQLLDYFRFCRTEFDEFSDHEFDFSDHRDYLDRNAWKIHTFDEPPGADPDYALEMTPEVIETTYLKAKQSAQEAGDVKVAGEFRVKRQQYSRQKNLEVVRDGSVDAWARVKNFGRAAENYFLGITCGYGMRPIRIGMAFLVAPLLYVPFYVFGGSLFTTSAADGAQITSLATLLSSDGAQILFENARFSYISYTTIGYGFIGPEGRAAEVMAASEAYLSVVLSALLVYALVKRSEL